MTQYTSAVVAQAIHALPPVSVYPSGSGTAVVVIAATSEPASASEIANAAWVVPAARPGRYARRCVGVPCRRIGVAASAWMDSAKSARSPAYASTSRARHRLRRSPSCARPVSGSRKASSPAAPRARRIRRPVWSGVACAAGRHSARCSRHQPLTRSTSSAWRGSKNGRARIAGSGPPRRGRARVAVLVIRSPARRYVRWWPPGPGCAPRSTRTRRTRARSAATAPARRARRRYGRPRPGTR